MFLEKFRYIDCSCYSEFYFHTANEKGELILKTLRTSLNSGIIRYYANHHHACAALHNLSRLSIMKEK